MPNKAYDSSPTSVGGVLPTPFHSLAIFGVLGYAVNQPYLSLSSHLLWIPELTACISGFLGFSYFPVE